MRPTIEATHLRVQLAVTTAGGKRRLLLLSSKNIQYGGGSGRDLVVPSVGRGTKRQMKPPRRNDTAWSILSSRFEFPSELGGSQRAISSSYLYARVYFRTVPGSKTISDHLPHRCGQLHIQMPCHEFVFLFPFKTTTRTNTRFSVQSTCTQHRPNRYCGETSNSSRFDLRGRQGRRKLRATQGANH